jgi:hypothetical protein
MPYCCAFSALLLFGAIYKLPFWLLHSYTVIAALFLELLQLYSMQ